MDSIPLREYVERVLADQEKRFLDALNAQKEAVGIAFAASEKAVLAAEENAKGWRQNANEWRGAMTDRERDFVRAIQHQTDIDNVRKDTRDMKERLDRGEGKGAGLNAGWGYLIAAVGGIAGIAALLATFIK